MFTTTFDFSFTRRWAGLETGLLVPPSDEEVRATESTDFVSVDVALRSSDSSHLARFAYYLDTGLKYRCGLSERQNCFMFLKALTGFD